MTAAACGVIASCRTPGRTPAPYTKSGTCVSYSYGVPCVVPVKRVVDQVIRLLEDAHVPGALRVERFEHRLPHDIARRPPPSLAGCACTRPELPAAFATNPPVPPRPPARADGGAPAGRDADTTRFPHPARSSVSPPRAHETSRRETPPPSCRRIFGVDPPGVLAPLPRHFRQRTDAVIGGHRQHVPSLAHLVIEVGQQLPDDPVAAQGHVKHFLRVRSPAMTDGVVGGKAETQQIRRVPAAQSFRRHGPPGQFQKHVVAKRRGKQRPVIRRLQLVRAEQAEGMRKCPRQEQRSLARFVVGAAARLVIELGPLPRPFLAHPRIQRTRTVELLDPPCGRSR